MTFHAITITPDGNTTCRTWTVTEEVRVGEHLRHAVGALVDVVALSPQVGMWIADDGGSGGAGYNPVATAIAATYDHGHRRYFGTVVFTGGPDPHRIATPLSATASDHLLATVQAALATYAGQHASTGA